MRKQTILLVLFFGSCWGAAEAILGEFLHRADIPRSSVPLTIIALFLLAVARVYCQMPGTSTLIASCAMLFKFTNAPFFGCHLLGIFLLGASCDILFFASGHDVLTGRYRIAKNALFGAAATYLGYALFAVLITYLFRHAHWYPYGLGKVLDHTCVSGTIAAVGSGFALPLGVGIANFLKNKQFAPFELRTWTTAGGMSALMMVLWIAAATRSF
ncbi:MAG: hypothetical protein JW829_08325 [Pirellulales bacterium]|nr:hypothetical protein [Pirellulales bacterium]